VRGRTSGQIAGKVKITVVAFSFTVRAGCRKERDTGDLTTKAEEREKYAGLNGLRRPRLKISTGYHQLNNADRVTVYYGYGVEAQSFEKGEKGLIKMLSLTGSPASESSRIKQYSHRQHPIQPGYSKTWNPRSFSQELMTEWGNVGRFTDWMNERMSKDCGP